MTRALILSALAALLAVPVAAEPRGPVWVRAAEVTLAPVHEVPTVSARVTISSPVPILVLLLHDGTGDYQIDLRNEGHCVSAPTLGVTCQIFQQTGLVAPLYLAISTGRQARALALACVPLALPETGTRCVYPPPPLQR